MPKRIQNLSLEDVPVKGIGILIDIANFVPFDVTVPSFFEFLTSDEIRMRGDHDRQFILWLESLRDYPELFDSITGKRKPKATAEMRNTALLRFDTFKNVREFVTLIADYSEKYRQSLEEGEPNYFWHGISLPVTLSVGDRHRGIADGLIRFQPEWYAAAFDNVDITKIRRCPVPTCKRIFWKSRKDKEACSKPCSTKIAVKNFRNPYKDKEKRKI